MASTIDRPISGQGGQSDFPVSGLEPPLQECLTAMLQGLQTVKDGDLSARLPVAWIGLAGKIADNFNEMGIANEQMASESNRVGQAVGNARTTRERLSIAHRRGAWDDMEVSVN